MENKEVETEQTNVVNNQAEIRKTKLLELNTDENQKESIQYSIK